MRRVVVLASLAGAALGITVVDHSAEVTAGRTLSLECTVDRPWQYCEW